MDVNVFSAKELSNEQIKQKIKNRESFTIDKISWERFTATVDTLEKIIEAEKLKYRTYTVGRVVSIGASALGGVTALLGLASGAAIAVHNLVTWGPDYEIGKNRIESKISVTYKKGTST